MNDPINNPLIELLEMAIARVKQGDVIGITVGYQTKEGQCRVICSEGDIELPANMRDEMAATAERILNKVN